MVQTLLLDARVAQRHESEDQTDLELIAAINRGDHAAFDTLYYRYRNRVVGLARRLTGDPNSALGRYAGNLSVPAREISRISTHRPFQDVPVSRRAESFGGFAPPLFLPDRGAMRSHRNDSVIPI